MRRRALFAGRSLGVWCVILMTLVIGPAGCAKSDVPKSIPVRGRVTFKGTPLKEGEVLYAPMNEGEGRPAWGRIQTDGTFTMKSSAGIPGVVVGKYRIAVVAFEPGTQTTREKGTAAAPSKDERHGAAPARKPLIPTRYFDVKQSELTDDVNQSHSGVKNFDLKE